MREAIPAHSVKVALAASFLGSLVGASVACIVFVVPVFLFTFIADGPRRFFVMDTLTGFFALTMLTFLIGLIVAAVASVLCALFLYLGGVPPLWFAIFAGYVLPLAALFWFYGESPYDFGVFLTKNLRIILVSFALLTISSVASWFIVRRVVFRIFAVQ